MITSSPHSQGKEGIPLLTERADESNGYVKGSIHQSLVQPRAKEMVRDSVSHHLFPLSVCLTVSGWLHL